MSMTEKIKILLIKRKTSITSLAESLGMSQSNLSNKLSRDNFSEKELEEMAKALDCTLKINFQLNDTDEII